MATPLIVIGLVLGAIVIPGCGEKNISASTHRRDEAGQLFTGPAIQRTDDGDPGQPQRGWSITVLVVRGGQELASAALERVQNAAGFRQAYLEKKGDAFILAYGNYPAASDAQAQTDLQRVQDFEFEGGKPFAGAVLTPPPALFIKGGLPEFNLMSVREDPLSKAKYTLQIGVYGRVDSKPPSATDLAEFRKTAEQAALQLRKEGDEAYYYHGPNKSMVMIGAFDETDYDDRHPGVNDSPRLKAAMEKYPYNLVNGAGYREKFVGGGAAKLQKSQIVKIPN